MTRQVNHITPYHANMASSCARRTLPQSVSQTSKRIFGQPYLSHRVPLAPVTCSTSYSTLVQEPFASIVSPAFTVPSPVAPPVSTQEKVQVVSNWHTLEDAPLSKRSLHQLFSNTIPSIRNAGFMSSEDCSALVDIIKTHKIVHMMSKLKPIKRNFLTFLRARITNPSYFLQ